MKIRTNLVTGIVMGIISIIFLIIIPHQIREPAFATGAPSPRIIPTIVFIGILLCSIFLIVQSLVFKKDDIFVFEIKREWSAIITVAMICGYAFLITQVGFLPAMIIFFPSILFYMGERKPFIYIFTFALGIGTYFLFANVFHIQLPLVTWFGR